MIEVIYGKRRADMEDAIAYEDLVQTIADLKAAGHAAGHRPQARPRRPRPERGHVGRRVRQGRAGSSAFSKAVSDGRHSTRSCASTSTRTRSRAMTTEGVPRCCWRGSRSRARPRSRPRRSMPGSTGRACRRPCPGAAGRVRSGRSRRRRLARGRDRDGRPAGQGMGAPGMGALPRRAARGTWRREACGIAVGVPPRRPTATPRLRSAGCSSSSARPTSRPIRTWSASPEYRPLAAGRDAVPRPVAHRGRHRIRAARSSPRRGRATTRASARRSSASIYPKSGSAGAQ